MHYNTIHDGHRDYNCGSCCKSFTRVEYLKKHTHTIHEGHKDHKCESCGKSFTQAVSLKKHIHTVHDGHREDVTNVDLVQKHFLKQDI